MAAALIGLGSNLGDRAGQIGGALERILRLPGVASVRSSALYETAPVGGPREQGAFLNAAAIVDTFLPAHDLLAQMRGIEAALQRDRDLRWGPRTIDLDLLLYDEFTIDEAELQVPHPRMSFRRFVIEPAAEIAANWVHPRIGWSLARLREHLLATPPSVALLGDAPRIHELAEMLRAASRQTPIFSAEWSQGQEPMVKAAKLSVLWRPDGRASAADWRGLAGRGPVLSLECRDATIARDEVLVAIAAMA